MQGIGDAFFTVDADWMFTFVNAQAARILHRGAANLIGRDWRTEFPGAEQAELTAAFSRALSRNKPIEFEEFYSPAGAWFCIRVNPLTTMDGVPDGLAVFAFDITGKRNSLAMLKAGRQRLALATESARIGIWDWDLRAGIMTWDTRMRELYGVAGQPPGDNVHAWHSGIHAEDRDRVRAAVDAALRGERDLNTELRVVWPCGDIHELESRAVVQRGPDGTATHMIGVNRDVSERKHAERAAERALWRLNEAQRIGLIGDWEYDLVTGITWSPQVYTIFGRDPGSGPPKNLTESSRLYEPDSAVLMREKVALALSSGEVQEYQLIALKPDGTRAHLQLIASPGKDAQGKVVSLHGTVQDVTRRKLDEQAISARARQQELIATLGRTVLTEWDLERVLHEAALAAAAGLNAEFSMVAEFVDDRSIRLKAGTGWQREILGRLISDAHCPAIAVMPSELWTIRDRIDFERCPALAETFRAHGVSSGIDVRIVCGHGSWGLLSCYSTKEGAFSSENPAFLQSLANIVASAIDRKKKEAELIHLAHHDPLTELPNRALLRERLQSAVEDAQRRKGRLAVLYLDLDQFKNVNDSFGHALGDKLLQVVARRLSSSVRHPDTVSRQGGDEFVILLTGIAHEADAAMTAERLLRSIGVPVNILGVELFAAGSIGIACYPEGGSDAETLLRNADAALYAAKNAGRNGYRFYAEELNIRARERLALESELGRAVERDQLFLHFQPQVSLVTGEVTGMEALVRWRHPALGIVGPGRFISLAEEAGLIVSIGNWVLEAACRQQVAWVQAGVARGRVAVNVSALQFRRKDFVDNVVATLARVGLEAVWLELEVTESAVMEDIATVREKLARLSEMGVTLAIDDFGTGQSSLSYLKQFRLHRLKLDQSFVSGLPDDKDDVAITRAVVGLGHSLGLRVIAEGIETAAQAEFLRELGCDEAQGFYYSPPLLPGDWAGILRTGARG